jgi:hypothetical protein
MKNIYTTLIIALGIIISSAILGGAYRFRSKKPTKIMVTGMAEYNFTSDLIVWNASFARKSFDIKTAFTALKEDEKIIREYFNQQGIKSSEIVFSSVNTAEDIEYTYDNDGRQRSEFKGYILSQTIKIQSAEQNKVEKISREITELLNQGINLQSNEPQYYYTKMADLKIDLLAKASQDGKLRAETIATNAGTSLGKLVNSQMGIFQITGQYENEDYSWGGVYNTSSKEKTASITVKMEFELK